MNESAKLMITKRDKSSKGAMNKLRKEGFVPSSMSQKGGESISFSVKKEELSKALNAHGLSGIYTLQADKKTAYTAMIHEIQHAPVSREWLHVTFQAVSLTEEATADVSVHLKGRDVLMHKGFELQQQLESIQIKGLPGDFPASIEIDVSNMEPGEQVTIADLKLPKGVTSLTEADRMVFAVSYPRIREKETAEKQEAPVAETVKPATDSEVK
jgi:large subunit ribosomal protein L25